jgi:HEPN domain-containing protein
MKPLTLEWIEKAEEVWVVMLRSYRARKDPSYNATCFHAQQCAEKYLKGRLEEAGIVFNKTHDLIELLNQATTVEPGWSALQPEVDNLNRFSVAFRYPGQSATKQGAKEAVQDCRKFRAAARAAFALPV